MFRKMPLILLAIILLILLIDPFMPLYLKQFLYSLSLSVKSLIIFMLPLIIFMLLFKTISQLSRTATKMIFLILVALCCSNFLSTMISYQIGSIIYQLDLCITMPPDQINLMPIWSFALPKLIANDHAMFSGIFFGILFSLFKPALSLKISLYFEKAIQKMLNMLTFIIPIFISGFIIKLIHDQLIHTIIYDYSLIFILVAISQFIYIACIYLVSNRFNFPPFLQALKNMLPAAITGFSSMSSAAAMPLTIIGSEKNTQNPSLTRLATPLTVNTHLIGDCFAIPIFAFAIMKNFGIPEPTFFAYLLFALYFVMAKFSVAAIPGGGIIVMLPILESQLGFTAEMSSLITALYILFDPVITCTNILGNGGFTLTLSKLPVFSKLAKI
ncbi:MAG: cation:dicarboxylate symporter family transporter [Candidatus Rhabdochlamydia sp.]